MCEGSRRSDVVLQVEWQIECARKNVEIKLLETGTKWTK